MVRDHRGQAVPAALGVVEVPLGVDLEAHRELVEVLGHLVVAVEALVEVDLAVAVEVAEDGDLVAAGDVDLAVDDLQAERLEEARGDPPPGQGPAGRRAPRPARRRRPRRRPPAPSPSGKKSNPVSRIWRVPGVRLGRVERVDGERPVVLAGLTGVVERLRPAPRAAPGQRLQGSGGGRGPRRGSARPVRPPPDHQDLDERRAAPTAGTCRRVEPPSRTSPTRPARPARRRPPAGATRASRSPGIGRSPGSGRRRPGRARRGRPRPRRFQDPGVAHGVARRSAWSP